MVENERRWKNDMPTGVVGISSVKLAGIGWSAQTVLCRSVIGSSEST